MYSVSSLSNFPTVQRVSDTSTILSKLWKKQSPMLFIIGITHFMSQLR